MSKTYNVPFSRIRSALLRRTLMIATVPAMLAANWLLILLAAFLSLIQLQFRVLAQIIAAPFRLLDKRFTEAWHGRGPGADSLAQDSVDGAA